MSYLENTIDWQAVEFIDAWLDDNVSDSYKQQPLAQDWARISKVSEELGETISELILMSGQNPRKGTCPDARMAMLKEAAQTALTGILAIQHFTKNAPETRELIRTVLHDLEYRIKHA